jgi:hypothetical protein
MACSTNLVDDGPALLNGGGHGGHLRVSAQISQHALSLLGTGPPAAEHCCKELEDLLV